MTMPLPPNNGDLNWGTELNNYMVNGLQAGLSQTETNLANHVAGAPSTATASDPHGDRAFAQQLMAPFTANVNGPSGFVQLTTLGQIPNGNWTDFRPVAPGFSSTGAPAQYPPQYQIAIDGTVRLAGYFFIAGTTYNGQQVFQNPMVTAARPLQPVAVPVSLGQAGTGATLQTPIITISPSGTVTLSGCPTGLPIGTAVGIYGEYPLDAYYNLIQS